MPNRLTRQERKAHSRDKILQAARVAFDTLGYEKATIRDIASRIGMSTGVVFSNFPGKEALYREVYGHAPISPELGRALMLACRNRMNDGAPGTAQIGAVLAQVAEA
jgi:AcrR family transcriptional regulator